MLEKLKIQNPGQVTPQTNNNKVYRNIQKNRKKKLVIGI